MGAEPLNIAGEIERWAGRWQFDAERQFDLNIVDAIGGIVEMCAPDNAKSLRARLYLRHTGEQWFVSFKQSPDDAPDLFNWFRIERQGDTVHIRIPLQHRFVSLALHGELPGECDPPDVILDGLKAEHYALIAAQDATLFGEKVLSAAAKIKMP